MYMQSSKFGENNKRESGVPGNDFSAKFLNSLVYCYMVMAVTGGRLNRN